MEENKNPKRNYVKTLAITGSLTAILTTAIIKGPEYIDKFVPSQYDESSEILNDTTYLRLRTEIAKSYKTKEGEFYSPRKTKKYVDGVVGELEK